MAAAAGKKEAVSLSLFHGSEQIGGWRRALHHGHALLGGRCVDGKMEEREEGAEKACLSSADVETGERTCRSSNVRDP